MIKLNLSTISRTKFTALPCRTKHLTNFSEYAFMDLYTFARHDHLLDTKTTIFNDKISKYFHY